MSVHCWIAVLLVLLSGCASTTSGVYSTGPAKHAHVLTLEPGGRYRLRQEFTDTPEESGRWWQVEDAVVVLLPDDVSRREHFARVADHGLPWLQLSDDLRGALTTE